MWEIWAYLWLSQELRGKKMYLPEEMVFNNSIAVFHLSVRAQVWRNCCFSLFSMNEFDLGFEDSQGGRMWTSVVLGVSSNSWIVCSAIQPLRSLCDFHAVSGTQGSESSMGLRYQSGLIRKAEATLGCSHRRDLIWNLFHKWWKTERANRDHWENRHTYYRKPLLPLALEK